MGVEGNKAVGEAWLSRNPNSKQGTIRSRTVSSSDDEANSSSSPPTSPRSAPLSGHSDLAQVTGQGFDFKFNFDPSYGLGYPGLGDKHPSISGLAPDQEFEDAFGGLTIRNRGSGNGIGNGRF